METICFDQGKVTAGLFVIVVEVIFFSKLNPFIKKNLLQKNGDYAAEVKHK